MEAEAGVRGVIAEHFDPALSVADFYVARVTDGRAYLTPTLWVARVRGMYWLCEETWIHIKVLEANDSIERVRRREALAAQRGGTSCSQQTGTERGWSSRGSFGYVKNKPTKHAPRRVSRLSAT